MEWRALSDNSVVDGQVSSNPIVRDARPAVSNKIKWIYHFNDAEAKGRKSVSLQGVAVYALTIVRFLTGDHAL